MRVRESYALLCCLTVVLASLPRQCCCRNPYETQAKKEAQTASDLVPFALRHLPQNVTDVLPYLVRKSAREGLVIRFPKYVGEYHVEHGSFFHYDFAVSTLEEATTINTVYSDKLSETVEWKYNHAGSMMAPLVLSSPYVSVAFHKVTPLVSTQHSIVSINDKTALRNQTVITGQRFSIQLSDGSTWLLYSSSPVSLRLYCDASRSLLKCTQLTSETVIPKGGFRLAMVKPGDTKHRNQPNLKKCHKMNELILDNHSEAIPLGAQPHIDEIKKEVHVQWLTNQDDIPSRSRSRLLMVALKREIKHMVNGMDAGVMWNTPRGPLFGVVSDEWQLV